MQNNSDIEPINKRKINPADKLKSRLFEKGIGHSSMSSFRSPLYMPRDQSNRVLLVNLTSNFSKMSPKVIRKQTAGLPNCSHNRKMKYDNQKPYMNTSINENKDRLNSSRINKSLTKQNQFLQQIANQVRKNSKYQTSDNFFNNKSKQFDKIEECQKNNHRFAQTMQPDQWKLAKRLVEKLSGKLKHRNKQQAKNVNFSPIPSQRQEQAIQKNQLNKNMVKNSSISRHKQIDKLSFQNYINRALQNQQNLQQFLYLTTNSKNQQDQDKTQKLQQDPYQLYVVQYDNNKQVEHKLTQKYYTISKKGLCYYVNGKPVEFIQLEEWVIEKDNYKKIKNLKFFNKFRKWKTVKMWKKIVIKHRIQQCSKNLSQKLFILNPIMRSCLFQIRSISLQIGKNMIILGNNQDDYSLENFKIIQQKNKKKVSQIIQQFSRNSRASVKKCFDQNLRDLKSSIKQKQRQEQQEKASNSIMHINLKDSAFQALGFPPKMSYQNRSRLRKLAGKFIRFSYLVDMIHSSGLALCFKTQLSLFTMMLQQSQSNSNIQIMMTRQDNKNISTSTQNHKIFNIKLRLIQKQLSPELIQLIPFKLNSDKTQIFNPIYHIRTSNDKQNSFRQYCPTICSQWLTMMPRFEDISEQIMFQIKQSLNCLKYFERWSKHRDMQKFINILEQWDDVVSQSREIAQNQNLDPVGIITNLDVSLQEIKSILLKSLSLINDKIREQFTQFLNIHWEQQRINLQLFRNPKLNSPSQTVQSFLKYITNSMSQVEKKIPYRMRLGIFEINLSEIRIQMIRQAEDTFNKFKQILPQVVEQNTQYLNNYFTKYNQLMEQQIKHIDDFVNKVKYIKQIEQTFEQKKQLCLNLTSIYQIMQVYKLNTKKRKQYESVTLKLKDQLQKHIYSFEQGFQRQSENYSKQVYKNYLPNLIKDINKLSQLVKNQKFQTFNHAMLTDQKQKQVARMELIRQIQQLQKKYEDIEQRNTKCIQYQQILNQCHGVDQQSLNNAKNALKKAQSKRKSINVNKGESVNCEVPAYLLDLINIKQSNQCLLLMWEKIQKWNDLHKKYSNMTLRNILLDRQQLQKYISQQRYFINNRLRRVLGTGQVVEQLNREVQVFETYVPIITGLSKSLSEVHWQQINQLIHKNDSSLSNFNLNVQKLNTMTLSDLISSNIGAYKNQFQQIFVKAFNELKLQEEYNEIEKKWKSTTIKTKIQGKYHIIYDQSQHEMVLQLINQTLDTLSVIFANPFSVRLQVGIITYQYTLIFIETYNKWINVQKKLVASEKLCKSIDLKKINQSNLIQNAEKQYKTMFKNLQSRNIDTHFNIIKFIPPSSAVINEKLQQCQRILITFENNIKNYLHDYRKNYPLFYQLDDNELLRVIIETNNLNSNINQTTLSIFNSVIQELICNKFMKGIVKALKFEGERLKGIYIIDDDMTKPSITVSISLTSDIESILDQIMQNVGEYTKRMLKLCRTKTIQNNILEMVDQFNVQFLVAITKVDFSNYTAISIQNNIENSQSLKQYLKIMVKDTKNGIKKLKQKPVTNVIGYQTLILQNLIHQKVLQQLVNCNISCANEYSWIKYLRFYWQDKQITNNNSEQSNINIKKMHINLRYGREYIGSKTKVLIQNNSNTSTKNEYQNLDMLMSIIRNSQVYCYLGYYQRLANFVNCIAHHIENIECTKQMNNSFGNPLQVKMMLKSRQGSDCVFYVKNSHLLSHQSIKQLLYLFSDNQYKSKASSPGTMISTNRHHQYDRKATTNITNIGNNSISYNSLDTVSLCYNPILLHIPQSHNTLFTINREMYRSVSLAPPNYQFLVCYLQFIQDNVYFNVLSQDDAIATPNVNPINEIRIGSVHGKVGSRQKSSVLNINPGTPSNKPTSKHLHLKTQSSQTSQPNPAHNIQNRRVCFNQTVMIIRKVFNIIYELQPIQIQNNSRVCIQVFLEYAKDKITNVLIQRKKYDSQAHQNTRTRTDKQIQAHLAMLQNQLNQNPDLNIHVLMMDMLLQYIHPVIKQQNFSIIYQYLKLAYPAIQYQQEQNHGLELNCGITSHINRANTGQKNKVNVKIMLGYYDCLNNYEKIDKDHSSQYQPCLYNKTASQVQFINLDQYTEEELFGCQLGEGLLHKIIYNQRINQNQNHSYGNCKKGKKIVINGINQRLVYYLSALIEQEQNRVNQLSSNQAKNNMKANMNVKKNQDTLKLPNLSSYFRMNSLNNLNEQVKNIMNLNNNLQEGDKNRSTNVIIQALFCKYMPVDNNNSNPNGAVPKISILKKAHKQLPCQVDVQIRVSSLSKIIDPKLLANFKIQSVLNPNRFQNHWVYIQRRFQSWCQHTLRQQMRQKFVQSKFRIFKNCILKFYTTAIKGLWKDLYKINQSQFTNPVTVPHQQIQKSVPSTIDNKNTVSLSQELVNIIRDFLNFMQTLIPNIICLQIVDTSSQNIFQKAVAHACIYSLCYVYRDILDIHTDYIKLENIFDKLQAQAWLCIPEKDRISPDQYQLPAIQGDGKQINKSMKIKAKRRYTYFDFIFDGVKLSCLQQYCRNAFEERIIQRGTLYLTNQLIHLNLITQRALKSGRFGMVLEGSTNSGKSSFCQIYRSLHHAQTAHISLHALNKNKKYIYNKICKVLSLKNIATIGPKLNYNKSLIVIDDLELPMISSSQKEGQSNIIRNDQVNQIIYSISSLLISKNFRTESTLRKYKLENVNFILCLNTNNRNSSKSKATDLLDTCSIRYNLNNSHTAADGIKNVFTQILKANILDNQIDEKTLSDLINVAFDFYDEINKKLLELSRRQKRCLDSNFVNLEMIKKMSMFTSHLRFKQNNSSTNQINRFWAYLLKDTLQSYCQHYQFDFNKLETFKKYTNSELSHQNQLKVIGQCLKQPISNILYSHFYVKQQVYGNGKQVEHVRDIRKLYNSINQSIQQYNKKEKIHRYGYAFQFISIDELIVKIVKMSNILLSGDYAIFSRKGSQINFLIRLVSYLQGFSFKQKKQEDNQEKKDSRIIDVVRETILQLTKVSLYLISVKIDDSNIEQFLQYYEADFQAEIIGSLQPGCLHSIQASGAFNFGIDTSQQYCATQNLKINPNNLSKNNQKLGNAMNNSSHIKQNQSHISKDLNESTISNRNRVQSSNSLQLLRVHKHNLRQISKMKRSIRLVYEFNSLKYLKYERNHPHYIAPYILSQIHIDFFHEYPQQCLVRFSQQILGIHTEGQQANDMKVLIQQSKDKIVLMYEIYACVRKQLELTLKQYEESIRLYWSFLGTFPDQIKQKISKYESLINLYNSISEIVQELSKNIQEKLEQKKNLTELVTQIRIQQQQSQSKYQYQQQQQKVQKPCRLQQAQSKLSALVNSLQQLCIKRSQCQKIKMFFQPSYIQICKKNTVAKSLLQNDKQLLRINLVLLSSYFTYLSKLPFITRKYYLNKWYGQCPSLKNVQHDKRLKSINQIFSVIRQQDEIITPQNEQFYQNMTIIFESIKPVLIRDDQNIGRNWMKKFDQSFVTVSQSQPDFYSKLGQYLANDGNILLQITDHMTLNNSQTNYINSLVFMCENTPKIQINDHQYDVSKMSKVYIVVAPHIKIPEQILSQHLYLSYQQGEFTHLQSIQKEILMSNSSNNSMGQKYSMYLQLKKRQNKIMNECLNYQLTLVNTIWNEFYMKNQQGEQNKENTKQLQLNGINIDINNTNGNSNTNGNETKSPNKQEKDNKQVPQAKNKQQIIQTIRVLVKSAISDKLQEHYDKYNINVKLLSQLRKRISSMVYARGNDIDSCGNEGEDENNVNGYGSSDNKSMQKLCVTSQDDFKCMESNEALNISNGCNKNPMVKILTMISKSYSLIQKINKFTHNIPLSLLNYYQILKKALKSNLLTIHIQTQAQQEPNKNNTFNMGMFVLFVLRQWGQRLNRQWYLILAFGLMMIIEEQVHGLESEIYNCGDMNKIKKESDIQSVHGRIGQADKSIQYIIDKLAIFIGMMNTHSISSQLHSYNAEWPKNYLQSQHSKSSKFLTKIAEQARNKKLNYSIEKFQELITQNITNYLLQQSYMESLLGYNNVATILPYNSRLISQNTLCLNNQALSTTNTNSMQGTNFSGAQIFSKNQKIDNNVVNISDLHQGNLQGVTDSIANSTNTHGNVNPAATNTNIKLNTNLNIASPDTQRQIYTDNSWILRHLIIMTGNIKANTQNAHIYKQEFANQVMINDNVHYTHWLYKKAIERLLDSEFPNLIQIKNIENIENQVKKIINDRTNILLPIYDGYAQSDKSLPSRNKNESKHKSQNILSATLQHLIQKYSPFKHVQQNKLDQSRLNRNNKADVFINMNGTSSNLNISPNQNSIVNKPSISHQNHSSAHTRVGDQFKIFIYHPRLSQLIRKIQKITRLSRQQITEKVFIRDISNNMNVNFGVYGFLKNKAMCMGTFYNQNQNVGPAVTNRTGNHHKTQSINTNGNIKTRSNIVVQEERQKSKFKTNQKSSKNNNTPVASMSVVQIEQTSANSALNPSANCNQPAQQAQFLQVTKTNKCIQFSQSMQSPNNSHANSTNILTMNNPVNNSTIMNLYEVINELINHIETILEFKAGLTRQPDSPNLSINGSSYSNRKRVFVPSSYFYGIHKIIQSIAFENQSWTFGRTVGVVCRILKNYVLNSRAFYVNIRDYVVKLLNKIIDRLEDPQKEKFSPCSTNRFKFTNHKYLNEDKDKGSKEKDNIIVVNNKQTNNIQKFRQTLKKVLQQDLTNMQINMNIGNSSTNLTDSSWQKYRQQSQYNIFRYVWLDVVKQFLGVPNIALSYSSNIFNNFMDGRVRNQQNTDEDKIKRSNNLGRKSKNISLQKDGQVSKNKSIFNIAPNNNTKLKRGNSCRQSSYQTSQLIESSNNDNNSSNKQMNNLAKKLFKKNAKDIQIKLDIIKNDFRQQKRSISMQNYIISSLNMNVNVDSNLSTKYMGQLTSATHNLILIDDAGIVPLNWRLFLREHMSHDQSLFLANTLRNMTESKSKIKTQLSSLLKDQYHAVDLSNCFNCVNFIKMYMINQFQQKPNAPSKTLNLPLRSKSSHHHERNECLLKKQQSYYYCITNIQTNDQAKKENFIKLKSVYASGWKLNNQGNYQITQEDKLTQLYNVYIVKKTKPQQVSACQIMLIESQNLKSQAIKLYAFTKKNQGQKVVAKVAYIKCPRKLE